MSAQLGCNPDQLVPSVINLAMNSRLSALCCTAVWLFCNADSAETSRHFNGDDNAMSMPTATIRDDSSLLQKRKLQLAREIEDHPLFFVHHDANYLETLLNCGVAQSAHETGHKKRYLWNPLRWDPRGGVAAELALCQNALQHPRRTEEIQEAKVVIMCLHHRLFESVPNCTGKRAQHKKLLKRIRVTSAWQAGTPHLAFGATELGLNALQGLGDRDFIVYANPSHWFDFQNPMRIPYAANLDLMDLGVKRTADFEADHWAERARDTLLFFRGTISFGETRGGLMELNKLPGVVIQDKNDGGHPTHDNYARSMLTSNFCLIPKGHTCTSRRYYDAVAAGCIPVIIDCEHEEYPFDAALNYSSFTLYYPLSAISDNKKDFIECLNRLSKARDFMVPRLQSLKVAREALIYGWYHSYHSEDTSISDKAWKVQQPSRMVDYLVKQALRSLRPSRHVEFDVSSLRELAKQVMSDPSPPARRTNISNSFNIHDHCASI